MNSPSRIPLNFFRALATAAAAVMTACWLFACLTNDPTVSAPTLASQPAAVVVADTGAIVKLGVKAAGKDLLYTWVKNGTDTLGSADTLTFGHISLADSGTYLCVVHNKGGYVLSDSVVVKVNIPFPLITSNPVDSQRVEVGAAVKLGVKAVGVGTLSYTWIKNGADTVTGATSDTLRFSSAAFADSGSYVCIVRNARGADTATPSALHVLVPFPVIGSHPGAGLSVNYGASANLVLQATGYGTLSYAWIHNGTDTVGRGDTLALPDIGYEDTGSYVCAVRNARGAVTTPAFKLQVKVLGTTSGSTLQRFPVTQITGTVFGAVSTIDTAFDCGIGAVDTVLDTASFRYAVTGGKLYVWKSDDDCYATVYRGSSASLVGTWTRSYDPASKSQELIPNAYRSPSCSNDPDSTEYSAYPGFTGAGTETYSITTGAVVSTLAPGAVCDSGYFAYATSDSLIYRVTSRSCASFTVVNSFTSKTAVFESKVVGNQILDYFESGGQVCIWPYNMVGSICSSNDDQAVWDDCRKASGYYGDPPVFAKRSTYAASAPKPAPKRRHAF